MDYSPIIKKIQHEQQFDAGGKPVEVVRIEYMVGTHGPFIERVPRADFTAAKVQQIMAATIDTLRALGATSIQ